MSTLPRRRWLLYALAIGGCWFCARPVTAQVTAYRLADLRFGPVVAGTAEQVQPTESPAARFQITAPAGTQLLITFTLPSVLVLGGSNLAIVFGATDAAWSGSSNVAAATRFDPRQPVEVTVSASGSVYLWIGGSVSPPSAQQTGAHAGTVTLSVTQL